jgi:hypothetical protein
MKASQKVIWEQVRILGFWRYILQYWVVIWGGSMILIKSAFNYFLTGSVRLLEIEAPIILITGFAAGTLVWFIRERRYHNSL